MITLLLALLLTSDFPWLPGGTYMDGVPSPKSFLGYEIGDDLTEHWQMVRYIEALAAASPHVTLRKIGASYERRDMYLVIVTSEANMAKLDQIQQQVARLTDPRSTSQDEANRIAAETPPIGWINCANDGDESAAVETGIQLAYQLAAGTDALTRKIRDNSVTVINMTHNPESHSRFVAWMKAVTVNKGGTADPNGIEHQRDWLMNTNNNHYDIDLNRDAFALSQVESRNVAKAMLEWNPQIFVDNHGQTNEYFFAPYADPVNPNLPGSTMKWATAVGRNNAAYFDQFGWSFYKRETFDLYYPGYWDSFPSFNGAVGMTYETDGGGHNGLQIRKADGSLLTLRLGIHRHFTTNMATLEVLADNRQDVLKDFYAFRASGMAEADKEPFKTYIIEPGRDMGLVHDLIEVLLHHKIEVYRSDKPIKAKKVQTYFARASVARELPAGSYVIPLKQPQKRLIQVLFEADPSLPQDFLDEVAAKMERNEKLGDAVRGEGLGFYDVTAWTLPVTYGLEASFTEEALSVSGMTRVEGKPSLKGSVSAKAKYGYLFDQETFAGAGMAAALLQEGYQMGMARKPLQLKDKTMPAGSLLARVNRNPESLHQRLTELAEAWGVDVTAVDTAWTEQGPSLGSSHVVHLPQPKVLVLTDRPVSPTGWGSVWCLLEQRAGMRFTAIRAEQLRWINLNNYNVLVLPDSWGGYAGAIGEAGNKRVGEWIRNGGVLIGIKAGAAYAVENDWTDITPVRTHGDGDGEPIRSIAGAIFRAEVNTNTPLGFGLDAQIAVQVRGGTFMGASQNGTNVVSFPAAAHMIGHTWEETEAALEGKAYLVDHPMGRGRLILFAEDPTFRNYWRGLDRLVMNALIYGPSLGGGTRY